MAEDTTQPAPNRFADLRKRVVTALVAAAIGVTLLYLGGVWTMLFVALVGGAMIWEYRSITLHRGAAAGADAVFLLGGVVGGAAVAELWSPTAALVWLGWSLAVAGAADLVAGRRGAMAWGVFGGAYIGLAAIAFVFVRDMEPHGFITALWIFLVVAAADVGGYFAGRLIGGPKLWPKVSPKKTWAGLGGGVVLAALVGWVFSGATTGTYFQEVCTVSAVAALLSQAGDLAESALKRHFGVKDLGTLLPGHGGAMDRFDGLTAATLVVGLVAAWRGQTVFIW